MLLFLEVHDFIVNKYIPWVNVELLLLKWAPIFLAGVYVCSAARHILCLLVPAAPPVSVSCISGQNRVIYFLTLFLPHLAELLEEWRVCATSEYLSRQRHCKPCCRHCGCLAQLRALLWSCLAELSGLPCRKLFDKRLFFFCLFFISNIKNELGTKWSKWPSCDILQQMCPFPLAGC